MSYGSLRIQRSSAFQAALRYIQNNDFPDDNRRIACTEDWVVAISGPKRVTEKEQKSQQGNKALRAIDFAKQRHGVDISSLERIQRFDQIIQKYEVKHLETKWEINNCAEASLWMTLEALHCRNEGPGHAPRHLHTHPKNQMIWVFKIDSHFRPKEDSPCPNCRQWVRREFGGLNGSY